MRQVDSTDSGLGKTAVLVSERKSGRKWSGVLAVTSDIAERDTSFSVPRREPTVNFGLQIGPVQDDTEGARKERYLRGSVKKSDKGSTSVSRWTEHARLTPFFLQFRDRTRLCNFVFHLRPTPFIRFIANPPNQNIASGYSNISIRLFVYLGEDESLFSRITKIYFTLNKSSRKGFYLFAIYYYYNSHTFDTFNHTKSRDIKFLSKRGSKQWKIDIYVERCECNCRKPILSTVGYRKSSLYVNYEE